MTSNFDEIRQSVQNAQEFLSTQYTKQNEVICESFFPLCNRGLTILSAKGGVGKSFLVLKIAEHLARENINSLLWLSEDSQETIQKRIKVAKGYYALRKKADFSIIDICNKIPPHLNEANAQDFKELFKPYKFVALDPLIAFFGGDENNNSEARRFMNILNEIARENNQAILLTHHSTKGSVKEKSRTRGAGAFVDSARLAYEMHLEDSGTRRVKLVKDNIGILNNQFKSGFDFEEDIGFMVVEKIRRVPKTSARPLKAQLIEETEEDSKEREKWEEMKKNNNSNIQLLD